MFTVIHYSTYIKFVGNMAKQSVGHHMYTMDLVSDMLDVDMYIMLVIIKVGWWFVYYTGSLVLNTIALH